MAVLKNGGWFFEVGDSVRLIHPGKIKLSDRPNFNTWKDLANIFARGKKLVVEKIELYGVGDCMQALKLEGIPVKPNLGLGIKDENTIGAFWFEPA